jgi:TolB protein
MALATSKERTMNDLGVAMTRRIAAIAGTLLLTAAGSMSASSVAAEGDFELESTIAFTSTRDNLALNPFFGAEIYLITSVPPENEDERWALSNPRRLTNDAFGDGFANLSPDGKRIAFDSNRPPAPTMCDEVTYINIDDIYLMNTDGTDQRLLTRGSSPTWSPDGKNIAFQASASYYASDGVDTGCPIRPLEAGSPTSDSDIFTVNVDDLLAGAEQPTNITLDSDPLATWIDNDPDWSPDGEKIVFTRHPFSDAPIFSNQAELFLMNPDGTGLQKLTANAEDDRAPAWSPDGSQIVFMCRIGGGIADFEICVVDAALNPDGSLPEPTQLTDNAVFDGTPTFSPDGKQIVFGRNVAPANQQLYIMNADGTQQAQMTFGTRATPDGLNTLPHWGELRVKVDA